MENNTQVISVKECKVVSARQQTSRLYVWVKGETVAENLTGRHSRPVQEYRKVIQPTLAKLGCKAKWSQYAGCSCGCSPGFILSDRVVNDEGTFVDLHFHILN